MTRFDTALEVKQFVNSAGEIATKAGGRWMRLLPEIEADGTAEYLIIQWGDQLNQTDLSEEDRNNMEIMFLLRGATNGTSTDKLRLFPIDAIGDTARVGGGEATGLRIDGGASVAAARVDTGNLEAPGDVNNNDAIADEGQSIMLHLHGNTWSAFQSVSQTVHHEMEYSAVMEVALDGTYGERGTWYFAGVNGSTNVPNNIPTGMRISSVISRFVPAGVKVNVYWRHQV